LRTTPVRPVACGSIRPCSWHLVPGGRGIRSGGLARRPFSAPTSRLRSHAHNPR
jgi:hypothetical protein